MKFGPMLIQDTKGCILGHTHQLEGHVIRKGTILDASHIEYFERAQYTKIVVAFLEDGDVLENTAAHQIALSLCGLNVEVCTAIAGRCNIRSLSKGVFDYDTKALETFNLMDWRVTIAAKNRYKTFTADATRAFWQVPQDEECYVKPPKEWTEAYIQAGGQQDVCWKLKRWVYGQRRAPQAWTKWLAEQLINELGLVQDEACPHLFYGLENSKE